MNFMNPPVTGTDIPGDILRDYSRRPDVKVLSKQYLMPLKEIRAILGIKTAKASRKQADASC